MSKSNSILFTSSIVDDGDEDDDQIELNENIFNNKKVLIKQKEGQQPETDFEHQNLTTELTNSRRKKDLIIQFEEFNNQFKMSKVKNFGFIAIVVIAVLITFFVTKYTNNNKDSKCPKDKDIPEAPSKNTTKVLRLPTNIEPLNYDIKLQTFLRPDQLSFTGSVSIEILSKIKTNKIQLNANELVINSKDIVVSDKQTKNPNEGFKIKNYKFENEVITIQLDKYLEADKKYFLYIPYNGRLTSSLSGFYRSSYVDPETKETKYFAMTQFQATDARRAFPCWDEPAFKATFDLTMSHWTNMTAIGNMPIKNNEKIDDQWTKTEFERTIKISTYLVAFAVGDFGFKDDKSGSRVKYRIVTRPSEIESANQAIIYGPKILQHFEEFFKIDYPLPKMDMLATPDFSAGAMENIGLITYRETYLLYNEETASVVQLYRICSVIAHELAHQWFGDLVTMSWWNDLWLNEGYATYMSYEGVNSVKPNWNIWDRFVVDEIHDVLNLDSLKNSHPISVEVNDPSEISEIFDHISYAKGASLIRMMTYIIGRETFMKGIHNYLDELKYRNAEQKDLWRHLQAAYDKDGQTYGMIDVKKIMDSWTLMDGYPLITVTRDYKENVVKFTQKRFLLNADESKLEDAKKLKVQYEVPISYTYASEETWDPVTRLWLHKNENGSISSATKKIEEIKSNEWLIVNLQETGYYRVNYDLNNWNLLIEQLINDPKKIHRVNRIQILDDLFHLAENDVVEYNLALKALKSLKKDDDPLILTSIGQLTYVINRMLRRSEHFGNWQLFIQNLIKPAFNRIGLDDLKKEDKDDLEKSQMQKSIVTLACGYYVKDCTEKSKNLFKEFMKKIAEDPNSKNNIPPNVRPTVYCTAIHHGDEKEWDFIFDLYKKEQNANEKNTMLSALTCSRIPWLLKRYLKWTFEENSGIKTQDAVFVFKGIASQNYGKDIAFNFLRENWEKIYKLHGKTMSFGYFVKSFDTLNSEFELDLIKEFYRKVGNKIGSARRSFLQTIEQIEANVAWMAKHENEIANFLNKPENRE